MARRAPAPRPPPAPLRPPAKLSRAIPVEHHALAMRLRGEVNPATRRPWTSVEVAAHLGTLGVTCSRMAVIRLEAKLSDRGDALLVQALRDEIRDVVLPQLGRVKRAAKHLDATLRAETNVQKIAAGLRAQTVALDTAAKLSGVAKPVEIDVKSGGQPLPDAYALLAAAVARLAEEPAAGAANEGPPKPPA